MYNRYLDDMDNGGFVLLEPESQGPSQNHQGQQSHGSNPNYPNQNQNQHRPNAPHSGGLGQLLDGVMKHFSLEHFDTGDILLVLIILFLYLEDGDNLELVITLGLLLLLGLDDGEAQG